MKAIFKSEFQVDLLVRAIIKFLLTISLLKLLFFNYIIIKYFLRTVREMAPIVSVPMNFGIHLLESPTHSTLELQAKNGAKVRASSVILSFNSPVVDHMITTLHLTTLDMEEFSEEAVRYFVHAAYTGDTPPIFKEIFSEIFKMSHVFKMTWLVTRCVEQFTHLTDLILQDPSFPDLLPIFEMAVSALSKLKTRELVDIVFGRFKTLKCRRMFTNRYLQNLGSLTRQQLDLIIELVGSDVHFIVEPLSAKLSNLLKEGKETGVPSNCKYLLENCDLASMKENKKYMIEKLFETIEGLAVGSSEDLFWVLQFVKKFYKGAMKSSNSSMRPKRTQPSSSGAKERPFTTSGNSKFTLQNVIPNLFHSFETDRSLIELIDWLGRSEKVSSLLMFFEGIWMWFQVNEPVTFPAADSQLLKTIWDVMKFRGWTPIRFWYLNFKVDARHQGFFNCIKFNKDIIDTSIGEGRQTLTTYISDQKYSLNSVFVEEREMIFTYEHKTDKLCCGAGKCGFILKVVSRTVGFSEYFRIVLVDDPHDYLDTGVHFHHEMKAESLHLIGWDGVFYYPLSWLGNPTRDNDFYFTSLPDAINRNEPFWMVTVIKKFLNH